MYSLRGIRQGKGHFVAIYRRYVSKMSWFWQDSRVVYPKSPANRRFGMHHVKNLPGRGAFPVRDLQIIHSVKILPPLRSRSFSFAATLVPVLPRHRCPPYRTRFLAAPAAPACPSASQSAAASALPAPCVSQFPPPVSSLWPHGSSLLPRSEPPCRPATSASCAPLS